MECNFQNDFLKKSCDFIVAVYPVNNIINISLDCDVLNSDWKPETKYN